MSLKITLCFDLQRSSVSSQKFLNNLSSSCQQRTIVVKKPKIVQRGKKHHSIEKFFGFWVVSRLFEGLDEARFRLAQRTKVFSKKGWANAVLMPRPFVYSSLPIVHARL